MVVGAERSAPRPLGTKMAINDRGEIAGAVSGGCVEGAVVEIAQRVIDSGRPELAGWTSRARRPRRERIHWATSRTSWPTSPTNSCNLRT
jgi:xanthine/CO dehydrogenase XdhC/CoxF family maturation factor